MAFSMDAGEIERIPSPEADDDRTWSGQPENGREKLSTRSHSNGSSESWNDQRYRSAVVESSSRESVNTKTLTLTGTIKRGRKTGEAVTFQVQLPEREARKFSEDSGQPNTCMFGLDRGPHVLIFSLLYMPVAFIVSLVVACYYGTITWYNIFQYYFENKTIWHRISLCPLLILAYPPLIVLVVLGLAFFSAFIQISWFFRSWRQEGLDFEKGFFSWVCSGLNLEDCSPYDVVVFEENPKEIKLQETTELSSI